MITVKTIKKIILGGIFIAGTNPVYAQDWVIDLDDGCQTKVQRTPEVRKGIMLPDAVLHDAFEINPLGRRVTGVWTFLGIDPGDRLEFDINVYANGIPIVLRSEHKPNSQDYDAWRWYPNYNIVPGAVNKLMVHVVANVTGENHVTPRAEGVDTARPHFGVWVLYACSGALGDTPDLPDPPVVRNPKDYVQWDLREEWATKIELAYTPWRGDRDLDYLLQFGSAFLKGGAEEIVPLTRVELQEIVNTMVDVALSGQRLKHRVLTERHVEFLDRGQVRKSVVNDMVQELVVQSRIYGSISDLFPLSSVCDTIKCKIQNFPWEE